MSTKETVNRISTGEMKEVVDSGYWWCFKTPLLFGKVLEKEVTTQTRIIIIIVCATQQKKKTICPHAHIK